MKHARLFFLAILVPVDYLMLLVAGSLTYFIRFESLREELPVIYTIPPDEYLNTISLVALGWIVLFALNGLYTLGRARIMEEIGRVVFGCATGFVAVLIYLVFSQSLFSSRFILLGTFLLAVVCVTTGRLVVRGLERLALKYDVGVTRLVLVGAAHSRAVLEDGFKNQPSLGYRVVKSFDKLTSDVTEELTAAQKRHALDGIMLADPNIPNDAALEAARLAEDLHLRFFYSADLFTAISSNITVHTFAGVPVLEVRKTRLDGWGRILKRTFDIVFSLFLLIITSPLLFLIALAVLLETGRPMIFKNERVGEYGTAFDTLKFRSMYQKYCIGKQFQEHAETARKLEEELIKQKNNKQGPVYKIKEDPRVTSIGRFIRRWSLDEIPQLWNVLRGDMSLVGPRPHQPREVEKYARHHRHVLAVKPGITGLAQISGRSDLDFEEEVRLDTYYIENWFFTLDLFILLKTPFVVLLRRGAY